MFKNDPFRDKILEIREKTGRGIMDSRKAFYLNDQSVEKAILWLTENPKTRWIY
jgi:translation elongation factor EF-Ts